MKIVIPIIAEIDPIPSIPTKDIIEKGDCGLSVKLVQELLSLQGFGLKIDSEFGPATEKAVNLFQEGLSADDFRDDVGIVGEDTWCHLWSPISNTLEYKPNLPTVISPTTIQQAVFEFARVHLLNNAHELPDNTGPWVRMYMGWNPITGDEHLSWCSAFVRFCIQQALDALGLPENLVWSRRVGWDCDAVAAWAKAHKCFYNSQEHNPNVGAIGLIYKSSTDWVHTGIVEAYDAENGVVTMIEGNTSSDGSYNGTSVCRKFRKVTNIDFVNLYAVPYYQRVKD